MRPPRFRYTTIGSNRASGLERLFRKWHDILSWFEEEDPSDLPYWYLERSNVGHLALAAYKINGRPLQEFPMIKGRGAEKGPGRADLYIDLPPGVVGSRPRYISIEAKQRWCSIKSKPDKLKKAVKISLRSAVSDCRELNDKGWKECQRIGISFILPYNKITGSNFDAVSEKNLSEFTDELVRAARSSKADFVAIHYAPLSVSKKSEFLSKYDWCPGIAVIGRVL